jgi:hypothetical protein
MEVKILNSEPVSNGKLEDNFTFPQQKHLVCFWEEAG